MFSPKSLAVFLPILLPYLFTTVNGAPTSANATDLMADVQLDKRDVAGWINTFADVGCHVPVGHYTRLENSEKCVNWDSNQPGLYFGINWGQTLATMSTGANNQIRLYTEKGCVGEGGAPAFGGSKKMAAGTYVQKTPKGLYGGKSPMGECFDGVYRHWPRAADGSYFQSFSASHGDPIPENE